MSERETTRDAAELSLAQRLWRAGLPAEFTLEHGPLAGKRLRVIDMDERGALVVAEVPTNG